LSAALQEQKMFPDLFTDMMAVGEQTGYFAETMQAIADVYERELDRSVGVISQLIPPIIIVIIAVLVGLVVFSILSAVFEMTHSLQFRLCANNLASSMLSRVALAIFFAAVCRVGAQEALSEALPSPAEITPQPLPESAWLDLRQNAPRNSKTQNAPAWVEALTLLPGEATEGGGTSKSIFRIRVAQPSSDYHVLFFRLFFDDKQNQQPELIAWD